MNLDQEYTQAEVDQLCKALTDEFQAMVKAEEESSKEESETSSTKEELDKAGNMGAAGGRSVGGELALSEESKTDKTKTKTAEGSVALCKDEPELEDDKGPKTADSMPAADAEAPTDEAPVADEAAPQEGQEEAIPAEGHADELQHLYTQLSNNEAKDHLVAMLAALFDRLGGDEEAAAVEGQAPEAAGEAPEAAPSDEEEKPFGKSEGYKTLDISEEELVKAEKYVGDLEVKVSTLEKSFKEAQKQNEELSKKLVEITNILEKATQPRAAVTNEDYFHKSEDSLSVQVTPELILQKLNEKAATQNLSKADRDKIYRFTTNPVLSPELKQFLNLK